MIRHRLRIGQTAATVLGEAEVIPAAERDVRLRRKELTEYINENPDFVQSLKPLTVPRRAPAIVRRMAEVSARIGVGPMAAVAGAIAESAVQAMVAAGSCHALFDNGGDIAMSLGRPTVVGIHTGSSAVSNLGFRVEPTGGILGICTSSATVGHSLSFGRADAAVVISPDVALADAAATALGNQVSSTGPGAVERALEAVPMDGIRGMLLVVGEEVGMRGACPDFCRVEESLDLISRG